MGEENHGDCKDKKIYGDGNEKASVEDKLIGRRKTTQREI
jgi:hypothetical protein